MTDHWDRQYAGARLIKDVYERLAEVVESLDWSLFDQCTCGHPQIAHQLPRHSHDGSFPCGYHDCGCEHFDVDDFERPARGNPLRRAA